MERIRSLDSLRGLAALVVVAYHFSLVVPGIHPELMSIWPLRFLIAGEGAVLVFFVLSGFVLFLSLQRHGGDNYAAFAVRRLARLWPPVIGAVSISAILYVIVRPGPLPDLDGWLTQLSWTEAPNALLLAAHFLLFDTNRSHTLDNPMWSLVVEIRLSLLFPLVASAVRRHSGATLIGCGIIAGLARYVFNAGHTTMRLDPFFTLRFLDLFALGAFMAYHRDTVVRSMRRLPGWLMGCFALALFCWNGAMPLLTMYLGSAILVGVSLAYPRLGRVFAMKPLVWLGERSFSLYLIHVPLLVAAIHALSNRLSIWTILVLSVPLCLVGAELFWMTIEQPSIHLSRKAGRWISHRF